jgi:hypothetical protein
MAAPTLTIVPPFSRASAFNVDPTIVFISEWGNVYEVPPPGAPSSLEIVLPIDPAFAAIAISPNSLAGQARIDASNLSADFSTLILVTPESPLVFPPYLQAAALVAQAVPPNGDVGLSLKVVCAANRLGFGPLLTTTQRSPAGIDTPVNYNRFVKPSLELYCYQQLPAIMPPTKRSPLIDSSGAVGAGVTISGTSPVVRGWSIGQRKKIRLEVIEVNGGAANLEVTSSIGVYTLALGPTPIATPILETSVATAAVGPLGSAGFQLELDAEHLFLRAVATAGVPRFAIRLKAED